MITIMVFKLFSEQKNGQKLWPEFDSHVKLRYYLIIRVSSNTLVMTKLDKYSKVDMGKQRTYSKYAEEASILLGKQIKLHRKRKKWSEKNLADRAGISRTTLQKIENGEMSCAIGLVFETAALVGINLFEQDRIPLSLRVEQTNDKIALLPRRIREDEKVVDDDF